MEDDQSGQGVLFVSVQTEDSTGFVVVIVLEVLRVRIYLHGHLKIT